MNNNLVPIISDIIAVVSHTLSVSLQYTVPSPCSKIHSGIKPSNTCETKDVVSSERISITEREMVIIVRLEKYILKINK